MTMSDDDESGFSIKETTLYMWRIETIRMALMWDTMLSPLFILFSLVLFPDLHFQLRTLTSCLAAVMVVVPLPFSITYRSGDMDYLLFFSRLTFL